MTKKLMLVISAIFSSAVLMAQVSGGVKGTVINRGDRSPIEGASLQLYSGDQIVAEAKSANDGSFLFENLADGMYGLVITEDGYLDSKVFVTVNDGYVKNMFNISLSPVVVKEELDASNFTEFDFEDSGYNDNPTLLFGQNDVFSEIAGYNFSAVRFKQRGYASESQDVYLAGVKMNDAVTGYSPFSLWSGLNEATRSKETSIGMESSKYGLGGVNGVTNIQGNASSMRSGFRGSVLTNSALYRLRLMLSYGSGRLDNGWSYAFNVSARLGGNDWIQGVYYKSFAYYGAVEKQFGDSHNLGLIFMASPGERGAQNASTQEVYDLMGDNMYNSNWGYCNGKVRNAKVKRSHEPIAVLKYDFTPSDKFKASASVLYRFGWNGYTALDWFDALDPRPDYYRNLPSYFYDENPDKDRSELRKSYWARDAWTQDLSSTTHINWDRLYHVNKSNLNEQGYARSKYVQEERHTDQRDLNFALKGEWKPFTHLTLDGGFDAKINRTEYFKKIADLLGGDYYVNVDNFAERDFSSSQARVQNDLDYYFMAGAPQVLKKGDKYGYDYYAQVRNAEGWLDSRLNFGAFTAKLGGRLGRQSLWRDGLVRKGLFPGLNDAGEEIFDENGKRMTSYDAEGKVITSKGKSETASFLTWAAKGSLEYVIGSKMRVYGNLGYFSDAPTFAQSFVSPRTRNSLISNLTNIKTFSADLNYQFSYHGYNLRVTAFYTNIMDMTNVRSGYDDLQNSFVNFATSGIDQVNKGIELGFEVPTFVNNLSVKGALSWGEYAYTSNPYMTVTVDNSSELKIENQIVPYWKSHPVFKRDESGQITDEVDYYQKHYVPGTPQLAASLGLSYFYNYWFIDLDGQYFGKSYIEMTPLNRTDLATAGGDGVVTPEEIEYMCAQEEFNPNFLLNFSIGKSWYRNGNQLGFSLQVKNILNNTWVKTGGYEQTRLVDDSKSGEKYYKFDSKYFYMCGTNYMLNLYFRF